MSKAAKRGKSAQGGGAGAKWEQGLLAAQFEEVSFIELSFFFLKLNLRNSLQFAVKHL